MSRIAVVGAGAKAAALVARAATLRALGAPNTPDIDIYEKDHVGAAWSGHGQFSSGYLELCTPAEKDVGFPYVETAARGGFGPVAPRLFADFSWSAYLVATSGLADWVDRGRRFPTHNDWATYLSWVFDRAGAAVESSDVTAVMPVPGGWRLSATRAPRHDLYDGVVLTGAGDARQITIDPAIPSGRTFDAETFWPHRSAIAADDDSTIAVIGDGGAAGAITSWLAERFAECNVSILCISPAGTLFPRGDGYAERRWFSDPSEWRDLSLTHRRKIIERTEAGVLSLRNKQTIDRSRRVGHVRGRAIAATWNGSEVSIQIDYEREPNTIVADTVVADYIISAIGFDSWSLLKLVQDPAGRAAHLRDPNKSLDRALVEQEMLADLSLPPSSQLPGGLHVPALAGLARGPGMSNLGCLGLMAAVILDGYRR